MEIKNYSQSPKKLICNGCDYFTYSNSDFVKHKTTRKHIKNSLEMSGKEEVFSICSLYVCSQCNYNTNIKSNYDKHLLTDKHINKSILVNEGEPKETKHICSQCNKEYKNYSGLWKHKKICIVIDKEREPTELQNVFTPNNDINQPSFSPTDLFLEVLKESKELQQVLIEQNKELQNNT
jgi:hypothetical protein